MLVSTGLAGLTRSWAAEFPAQDLEFLRGLTRDVVAASRVKPAQKAGSSPANSCGVTLIMPGGRGSYPAYWIRDFAMSLESGFITWEEMRDHLRLTVRCQNGPVARRLKRGLVVPAFAIPDHINFDGSAVFYPGTYSAGDDQGTGTYGILPPVDDHYEIVHIAWCLYRATGKSDYLQERINGMPLLDRLAAAFAAPTINPQAGLVVTDEAQPAVGFGFCDAIHLAGQILFPSLLRYRAAGQLAALQDASGYPERAAEYRKIQELISANLTPTFGEPGRMKGWLMAATKVGRQPDVWGTVYALHLGALPGPAAVRARETLIDAVRRGTITCEGAVRHVPTDFDASPKSAWERTAGVAIDSYQNGAYWHTPTGWLIAALRTAEPDLAAKLFREYIRHLRQKDFRRGQGHEAPWECFNAKGYAQNGIYMTSVTLPWAVLSNPASSRQRASASQVVENSAFRFTAVIEGRQLSVTLDDKVGGFRLANGPYVCRADRLSGNVTQVYPQIEDPSIKAKGDSVVIAGRLAGLDLEHTFALPQDRPVMEERIQLRNSTEFPISLNHLEAGLQRRLTDAAGQVLSELAQDRWAAVPLRARATDPKGYYNDFSIRDLVTKPGFEPSVNKDQAYSQVPSAHRHSEGWAWTHGRTTLGIFTFNQENMCFSVVSHLKGLEGDALRFGGACMISGEPAALTRMARGQAIDLGVVRYQTIKGGYTEACYAHRAFLDEMGCRFPNDYDPPVHWEQLYDMPEAWTDRPHRYTNEIVEREARKGRDYSCEALYLDPGWDTDFGTFLWGESWLGPRKTFVEEIQSKYGLKLSLHCPLASWMSHQNSWGLGAVKTWPQEAVRLAPESSGIASARLEVPAVRAGQMFGPLLCLGSQQYLQEAEKRLLANCADGAVFLMYDGNWWNGGCQGTNHGHPVPYRWEDHIRANLDLAQRIHARYPKVLIEMHDPITGGSTARVTPVYYKYGLPGSYDENWGFELMWDPLADIKQGRTRSLYYYNLGCNVPVYLHVNLSQDNESCVVLWWYASTCRHLGIGGTSPKPAVVMAHKQAMKRYRELDRFFKRGEFYGISEEIHLHTIPRENAFVVNAFNLSDQTRVIAGEIDLARLGVDPKHQFTSADGLGTVRDGRYVLSLELPPWSARVAHFQARPSQ